MKYHVCIVGTTILEKDFDRFSRAKKWTRKQLEKLDSVYNTATITKCGNSTGNEYDLVTIFGCNRNFNGEITVS